MTADQRIILEVCVRYRVLTVEALARTHFEGLTTSAVRSAITRLLRADFLFVALHLPERKLYQLTPKAAAALRVPASVARPLQAQGIRRRYGILAYCCLGSTRRHLLAPQEFTALYPELADAPGIDPGQQDYMRMRAGGREVLLQATLDNEAQRDSVVRKAREIIARAHRIPSFYELVNHNRFNLVILTASDTKAAHINDYLEHLGDAERLLLKPVRIEVVPRLLDIPGGS